MRTDCPDSPPLFLVICEMCFTRNFTRDLVEIGEGSWHIFLRKIIQCCCLCIVLISFIGASQAVFCSIDGPNGVTGILDSNRNHLFPISRSLPNIELYFAREDDDDDDGSVTRQRNEETDAEVRKALS